MHLARFGYRPEIDGLRALAVLLVLAFHLDPTWLPGGFLGVDIFFVISGYLITSLILEEQARGEFRLGRFYVRRLRRLAPALLATLFITLATASLVLGPVGLSELAEQAVYASVYLSNWHFLDAAPRYFTQEAIDLPLLHTWSLSVEEQFYLVWPALILLIARLRLAFALAFAGLFLAGLFAALVAGEIAPRAAFFNPLFRLHELGLGALIACVPVAWLESRNEVRRIGLRSAGFAVIAIAVLSREQIDPSLPASGMIASLGAGLILLSAPGPDATRLLTWGPVRYLGRISYSLYLAHWPVISLYFAATHRERSGPETLLVLGLCLALAMAMHHAVEQPFRVKRGDSHAHGGVGSGWPAAGLAAGLAGLLFFAGHIWGLDGWPGRSDPERLAQARQVEVSRRGFCGRDAALPASPPDTPLTCWLGSDRGTSPSIIVMGDSHAHAWSQGLDREFERRRCLGVYVGENGLLTLPELIPVIRAQTDRDAPRLVGARLDWAIAQNPDLVILSARWAVNWHTRSPGMEFAGRRFHLAEDGGPRNVETSQAALESSLVGLLERFRDAGIPVLILGQTPHLGAWPNRCVERPRWFGDDPATACVLLTAQSELARIAPADAMLRRAVEEAGHGEVFSTSEPMCAGRTHCRLFLDDFLLYRDDHHFSRAGARLAARRWLAPVLDTYLGPAGRVEERRS